MRAPEARLGPKGLPLPVWKPEYEQAVIKRSIQSASLLSTLENTWSGVPASVMVTMLPKQPAAELSAADRMLAEVSATSKNQPAAELSAVERMMAEMQSPSTPPPPPSTSKALVVGNSTSDLAEQLQRAGYGDVLCVDPSEEATASMAKKHASDTGLRFETVDFTNMSMLSDDSFNLVIDRGVIDSLICGDDGHQRVAKALSEIQRVTTVGGIYVCFSHNKDCTDILQQLLSAASSGVAWNIKGSRCVYDIQKSGDPQTDGIVFYKYVCHKSVAKEEAV
eukprot:CAMPEP_0118924158 /NCGR_PEP_ID=MMETSP1169-20130426/2422_1 /TAXON_ID=36882 /ORGANISM="Pyramimonas obovata, Strain CCMP722" /LENGTH=278 /DNA_ID=CAMNT_0006865245 /DNA_START=21 /DNA_END=857 /DNA_ORIENTATION=+